MTVRRFSATLAMPCLCLAAQAATAQSRLVGPPLPSTRPAAVIAQDTDSFRLRPDEMPRTGGSGMIQSWVIDRNAEFGLGRFTVPNGARPRTHTERLGSGTDTETRRIAGAGMQIRF